MPGRSSGSLAAPVVKHELYAPKVSVVTAAYNAAPYIGETIESVRNQTLADFEVLVVDDGSTDETAAVVEAASDPRVRLIRTVNRGVSAARNEGLEACAGPVVVFLDADDLLMPTALMVMTEALAAHPDRVACFGHHIKIDIDGNPIGQTEPSRLKSFPQTDTLQFLLQRNFINNGGAVCLRTDAARRAGGFDPALSFAEDLEFWCRVAALGDFLPLAEVVLAYRVRPGGANSRLAGTPFRPNHAALERIFAAPAVQARYGDAEVGRLRRQAEANHHWSAARNEIFAGRFGRFATYLFAGLVRHPQSVFQWRSVYLFARSLTRRRSCLA